MVDIDRPSTWKSFKPSLCSGCFGGCCQMPVEVKWEDLVRLGLVDSHEASQKKAAKRLLKEGILSAYRAQSGLFMLSQKSNRDCYYLNSKTRLCEVYEKRPGVCRDFPVKVGPRLGFCPSRVCRKN